MDKIVGYIYETTDYDKFERLDGNRFVDHSQKIVESIQNNGQLNSALTVNEKYQIIDGQNRFEAYKQLSLPVRYTVEKGYGINECIAMNSVSKNWKTEDFIASFAELGNQEYIDLKYLLDKYCARLSAGVVYAIAQGNIALFRAKEICNGTFKIGKEGVEYYNELLDYLCRFNLRGIRGASKNLYKVLAFCYVCPLVDNEKLVDFMEKYGYLIKSIVDTKQAAEEVERVYNFRCKRDNWVMIANLYKEWAWKRQGNPDNSIK